MHLLKFLNFKSKDLENQKKSVIKRNYETTIFNNNVFTDLQIKITLNFVNLIDYFNLFFKYKYSSKYFQNYDYPRNLGLFFHNYTIISKQIFKKTTNNL